MSCSSTGNTVSPNGSFSGVGGTTSRRSESEVVVGRNVECSSGCTGQLESIVVVVGLPIEADDSSASNSSDGSRETSVHSLLESTGVERVEIRVECSVALVVSYRLGNKPAETHVGWYEMSESRWVELLVQEITDVTNNDQDQVTDKSATSKPKVMIAYLMYVVTKTK